MMNAKTKQILRLGLIAGVGGAALGLAAGCQRGRDRAIHGEMFPADEQVRPVDRVAEVQASAAARSDATLNAFHFDRGSALNSLGRAKLDLMLRDDEEALPLVVYLDVRGGSGVTDRHRDAVRHYLADRGVGDAQLELRDGPNFEHTRPARDGLRGLRKIDGPADAAAAEAETALPQAAMPLLGGPARK